jgi:hypothetical protein
MDVRKRAADLYKRLSLIPSIDNAYFLPPSTHSPTHLPVLIKSSQTDVHQAKKRTYITTKTIDPRGGVISTSPFPFDVSSAALVSVSPSGERLAVVRVEGDKKDEPFIEVCILKK